MIIYYRISDGGFKKDKVSYATKYVCLDNFLTEWKFYGGNYEDRFTLVRDNLSDATRTTIEPLVLKCSEAAYPNMKIKHPISVIDSSEGSSGRSFRKVFSLALHGTDSLTDDEIVYFVEDDYLHLPGARNAIIEGLTRADYVTLYTHPDKFIPASQGGNPEVGDDGAEVTKVFLTNSTFWMLTNSTTMTFATTLGTLKKDKHIISRHCQGAYPTDYNMFGDLSNFHGRSLVQPLPTYATHVEEKWLSPLVRTDFSSWKDVVTKK